MITTSQIRNGKILVVDDKQLNVDLMKRMLADSGYTSVDSTTNPNEVCSLHRKNHYDLILLDLLMPGMDGFQVMEALKEIQEDDYLPILVITAQPDHKLRALQSGAKDFITKPFDMSELKARVHNILEVRLLHIEIMNYSKVLEEMVQELESNRELVSLREALEDKVEQLALTSRYKSEFLANMSHELRTPLNNLLLLARMLSENPEHNLTDKQVKYAEAIRLSGTDLLTLINEVLDLGKIESGHMDVGTEEVQFPELKHFCFENFRHLAESRNIEYTVSIDPLLIEPMVTDRKRLQQIMKNLISNSLKFTTQGSVKVSIAPAKSGWIAHHSILSQAKTVVEFQVVDTGIGVALDKQGIIFDAFQQADGTTSRKYGGTGLGLSISRELARVLGGEIRLTSQPGRGSTFTLYLPLVYSKAGEANPVVSPRPARPAARPAAKPQPDHSVIEDDRANLLSGDPVLLIVEDDPIFSRILIDMANAHGLKGLLSPHGSAALMLAAEFQPVAITLDIGLPDMKGWAVLDRLKHDSRTRQIPVYVISGTDQRKRAMSLGAANFVQKADGSDDIGDIFRWIHADIQPRIKKLMVVSASPEFREKVSAVVAAPDVELVKHPGDSTFLEVLENEDVDAFVFDFALTEIPAVSLIERLQARTAPHTPPAIVMGPPDVDRSDLAKIALLAGQTPVRYVSTSDGLLKLTFSLLNRPATALSADQKDLLKEVQEPDRVLAGRTILIVDDDPRNILALTGVLEQHGIHVLHAQSGPEAIETLERNSPIDAVLMDIMMPGMDGCEAIQIIRGMPQFAELPLIALTAKAMQGDREECLQAGASEYVTKPIDIEHLFSVLRVLISDSMATGVEAADRRK